jgi:predicted nucleotidyltransferase
MTEDMNKLEEENSKMKEGLLDVQCRSMKNKLIFTGLSEQEGLLTSTSSLLTYSISRTSTTFDFFFFSSLIIGYKSLLRSSISGGNCSLCRSMKNKLIFTGLSEQEGENCEGLLRDFLYYEMNIGGNCSLTPKCVPFKSLPEFFTSSKSL